MAGRQKQRGRGSVPGRVGDEIRMRVSDLLLRETRDPRLAGMQLTRVDMTGDLSRATLWFRCVPGLGDPERVEEGARAASGFLRRELGRSLRLRTTPELVFRHDDRPEEDARLEAAFGRHSAGAAATADDSEE